MASPTLIHCAGGNSRFAEIAINAGFKYGSQLPETVYFPLYFADQDWKKPNRMAYIEALKQHHPYMATVLDWEYSEQLPEVLSWAEDIAPLVEEVMIIPKVQNGVLYLPRMIGGKAVRLGYSVPTRYGGTQLMANEFIGWPVHLLGGSPYSQFRVAQYLNVVSVDGNMPQKMALRFGKFFDPSWRGGKHSGWPKLLDVDHKRWEGDMPYEVFRRSCENIIKFWGDK